MSGVSGVPGGRLDASSLLAMRQQILQNNDALQKAAANAAAPIGGLAPAGGAPTGGTVAPAGGADFTSTLRSALTQVNSLQGTADAAADSYERGDSTDIAAVMLSREQASVGFQATLQVRNKLLSAYKDIMSMPV